ncbi:hypothetical protein SRB5_56200 [Streptomyces sp. RB5]|uniref:Gram-positive cocci surface proteins LPxTG domain-containing protein n=1 Tax=Streptomyces smaragdinus TaxID=2585196 RepID=A0A7K0CPN3_9ACTN|nr:hypothetical protein [Streptomyces smaragdinus]MQY15438.1 hypothetical protein [Streptomyces smaragdinus]
MLPSSSLRAAFAAAALVALGAAPAAAEEGAGPVLTMGTLPAIDGARLGSTFDVPAVFANVGDASLQRVYVTFAASRGLEFTDVPANCLVTEGSSLNTPLSCVFEQEVRPGKVYALPRPLTVKVGGNALYDTASVMVSTYDAGAPDGNDPRTPGTAPAVTLTERPDLEPADPGPSDHPAYDSAEVKVTADNTADFRVTGAHLKGRVGDTVPLTVKFTDAGPAWVRRDDFVERSVTKVRVRIPAGTTVTRTPGFCHRVSAGVYECGTSESWVLENFGETYSFKLRIDKAVPGAKGSVALEDEPRPFDPDKGNDTAAITLTVPGSGGPSGGSGPSDPGGSQTSGGSSDSTAGDAPTTGTSDTPAGGELAATGSDAALPLTGAAAAAIALGTAAVVVTRRRRTA